MAIKLAEDTITLEDRQELAQWILNNDKLTKGELTKELETKFANAVGSKYAVFVNSGSSANLLALYSILEQMSKGRDRCNIKVGVPSICWATDYAPIVQLNALPVIIDVEDETYSISVKDIPYNIDVLILISVLGFKPKNLDQILFYCKKNNIRVILDNCESLGTDMSQYHDDCQFSTWSTYYGHHISTIEGGFVTTNNFNDYENILALRSHGWIRDLSSRSQKTLREAYEMSEFDSMYRFIIPGFNVRNNEIGAFLGLRQLDRLDGIVKKRHDNYQHYYNLLSKSYKLPKVDYICSNFAVPITFKDINQKETAIRHFAKERIECRPLISGSLANHPMVRESGFFVGEESLKVANRLDKLSIYVPNHHNLGFNDIDLICNILLSVMK